MTIRKFKVEQLKEGMMFDKAVSIDTNSILVAPFVPLKEEDINRLVRWRIEEVQTEGELIDKDFLKSIQKQSTEKTVSTGTTQMRRERGGGLSSGKKSFSEVYTEAMNLVKDIFERMKAGGGFPKEKMINISELLLEEVKKDKNRALDQVAKEEQGNYLYSLGVNVAILSVVTGHSFGLDKEKLTALCMGALIHDIGMVRVPGSIIAKKGTLTPDEYNRIKTHPIYGYRIALKELNLGIEVARTVLEHHEAYDGNGYPRGLKGDEISLLAKIVSICDVFAAMTKRRSYRDEHLLYQAMKSIVSESSRKFAPEVVKVFLSNMAIYPVGSIVQLNNSVIGKVISANPKFPIRPKISILLDEFGDKVEGERVIDLQEESSLYITKPISKNSLKTMLNE